MAMNFPDSPSNGDTVTLNSKEYAYSSANSTWLPASEAVSASTVLSDTAPVSPSAGDTWYNTDDGTMNVYYNDGSSSQWVGTSGPAGPVGPAGAAGSDASAGNSTTFVADTAALIALSSMSTGDQALVQDTNKLFMYTGSAWYLIATMVNASPTPISGVAASYVLEKDGTATTITAVSTDPEGFPLTWSYAVTTGSLGSTATVSQADNVFTITPSADSADAGEFSITFSATDGGNTGVVNAISAFTLTFAIIDPNFNQVSFLSHFDGTDNGVNNVFTDSSAYPHTITANGNVTQGSFGPFARPDGEWAVALDGASTLNIATNTGFGFSTGDFTIECWVNWSGGYGTSNSAGILGFRSAVAAEATLINIRTAGTTPQFSIYDGPTATEFQGTTIVQPRTWYHVVSCRSGTTWRLFVNGVIENTHNSGSDLGSSNPLVIGSLINGLTATNFSGSISDIRVVKGTAIYTEPFTPPTAPLTAIANTKLLTCQSNRVVDNSASAHTITPAGNPSVSAFGPFLTSEVYDPAVNGASAYFDGTGDYLIVPNSSDFDLGPTFTIDTWLYRNGAGDGTIAGRWYGADNAHWIFHVFGSGKLAFGTGSGSYANTTSVVIPENSWVHVAVSNDSFGKRLYINGVQYGSYSQDNPASGSSIDVGISANGNGDSPINAYLYNLRIIKGTALYTGSTYTVPTAPLTAITNTTLLLNMADGQAIDSAAQNNLTLYGNAKISSTQSKFGGTSLALDGTGDYAYIPDGFPVFATGEDMTIEFWINPANVTNGTVCLYDARDNQITSPVVYQNNAGIYLHANGTDRIIISGGLSAGTWAHVALVRSSGVYKLYLNGTASATTWANTDSLIAKDLYIGASYHAAAHHSFYNGFIDEFRISKMARYTADFTAPVLEFGGQGI